MAWNKKYYTPEQLREYYKKYYKEKRKAKLDEARAEHPVHKVCTMSGEKFVAKGNQKYGCDACSKLATKIKQKILRQGDKFKETQAKYRQTEKYKETKHKYYKSEKGQEALRKYRQTEKYKEAKRKYEESGKGKEACRRYYQKRKANGGLPLSQINEETKDLQNKK